MTESRLVSEWEKFFVSCRSQQLSSVKIINAGASSGKRGLSSLLAEYSLSVADFQKGLWKIVLLRKMESMHSAHWLVRVWPNCLVGHWFVRENRFLTATIAPSYVKRRKIFTYIIVNVQLWPDFVADLEGNCRVFFKGNVAIDELAFHLPYISQVYFLIINVELWLVQKALCYMTHSILHTHVFGTLADSCWYEKRSFSSDLGQILSGASLFISMVWSICLYYFLIRNGIVQADINP